MAPAQQFPRGQGYWRDSIQPIIVEQTTSGGGSGGTNTRTAFTGTIDGNNRLFTLPTVPNGSNLEVFWNGILVSSPDDYTLSGVTVTFSRAPQVGDTIVAYYGSSASRQTVSGTQNGINVVFTLPSAPSATSLQFFVNGLLQHESDDYTLSSNQLTLTRAPGATDTLVAYF